MKGRIRKSKIWRDNFLIPKPRECNPVCEWNSPFSDDPYGGRQSTNPPWRTNPQNTDSFFFLTPIPLPFS